MKQKFPKSFIEELRSKILISDVIGKKIRITKKGNNEYLGLCPFHNEKTPSFTVNDQKGFYHCFGCGAHGDAIKFLMDKDGIPYQEAINILARDHNIVVPKFSDLDYKQEKKITSLYEVVEQACQWYQRQLYLPVGNEALSYLKKRGLSDDIIKKFRIGFAPSGKAMSSYLLAKGITEKMLTEVGLFVRKDSNNSYDRFTYRIIFPILDVKNRVIAFGGRGLGDRMPKYLNSPETILFKKSDVLFNENFARSIAFKTGKLVVAEGYMDVISMYANGIKSAVAPLGTALTEKHINRLWYMVKEPVLCMDGDRAGIKAMERSANIALPALKPGFTMKFAKLPSGLDPDDFIKSFGVNKLRELLKNAMPLSQMLWSVELNKHDISTPEKKADLASRVNQLSDVIKDPQVSRYYNSFFKEKLWQISGFSLVNKGKKTPNVNREFKIKKDKVSTINADLSSIEGCEVWLINALINNPQIFEEVNEELINIDFSSNKLDKICSAIIEILGQNPEVDRKKIIESLEKEGFSADIGGIISLGNMGSSDIEGLETGMIAWNYIFDLYKLAVLKKELDLYYKLEEEEKAKEICKLISQMKASLEKKEINFEKVATTEGK